MLVNPLVLHLSSQGQPYEAYDLSFRSAREWRTPVLSYALLHSVALCGALCFRRMYVLKTVFLIVGLLLGLQLANRQLLKVLLPGSPPIAPFGDVWVGKGRYATLLALPVCQGHLVLVLVSGLLWLAAYNRLTEKQS